MKKLITTLLAVILLCTIVTPIKSYAIENKWIYYSNHNDVGRLYKIHSDGTGITRLSMQTACDIEVLDDWVYYYNTSATGGAFRTKTDGSKTEKLVDGAIDSCYGIYKSNENVYIFSTYVTPYSDTEPLYTSNILIYSNDGYLANQCLNESNDYGNINICVGVKNTWLYCKKKISNSDTEYNYYKIDLNGLIEYDFDAEIKEIEVKNIPKEIVDKAIKSEPRVNNSDYFRNKKFTWNSVNESEKYIVYRLNKTNGKYKRLAETKDTSIDLTVLNSDYNAEYKVVAVKTVDGITKNYKANINPEKTVEYKQGNTSSNLSNGSFVAKYNGMYYVCLSDGIYTFNEKGIKKKKICDDTATCINISDGWIYYANQNDYGYLYKVKIDGTKKNKMESFLTPKNGCIGKTKNIIVANDCIYISSETTDDCFDIYDTRIIKLKTDDTGAKVISQNNADNMCIINDKLIFLGGYKIIYSLDIDGKNEINISEKPAYSICTYNNKIYYCGGDGIYTMNYDGTEVKLLYSTSCKSINIYDDKIYVIESNPVSAESGNNYEYYICSMNTDGTDYKKLCKTEAEYINIVDNWIFIKNWQGNMYRCKTDGTCLTEVGMWEYDY